METQQMPATRFPDARLADCAEREVAMRRAVYPRSTKLSDAAKAEELAMMQAIAERLKQMDKAGPLFKEVWGALDTLKGKSAEAIHHDFWDAATLCGEGGGSRAEVLRLAALCIRLLGILDAPAPAAPAQPAPKYQEPAAVAPVAPVHAIAPGSITGPTGAGYATAQQKEEIIRRLNHPAIRRQDKTKILLNINKLTPDKATALLAELKQKADDYDGPGEVEGLQRQLRRFVEQHGEALAMPECERLLALCETTDVTASLLRDNLAAAREEVGLVPAA